LAGNRALHELSWGKIRSGEKLKRKGRRVEKSAEDTQGKISDVWLTGLIKGSMSKRGRGSWRAREKPKVVALAKRKKFSHKRLKKSERAHARSRYFSNPIYSAGEMKTRGGWRKVGSLVNSKMLASRWK